MFTRVEEGAPPHSKGRRQLILNPLVSTQFSGKFLVSLPHSWLAVVAGELPSMELPYDLAAATGRWTMAARKTPYRLTEVAGDLAGEGSPSNLVAVAGNLPNRELPSDLAAVTERRAMAAEATLASLAEVAGNLAAERLLSILKDAAVDLPGAEMLSDLVAKAGDLPSERMLSDLMVAMSDSPGMSVKLGGKNGQLAHQEDAVFHNGSGRHKVAQQKDAARPGYSSMQLARHGAGVRLCGSGGQVAHHGAAVRYGGSGEEAGHGCHGDAVHPGVGGGGLERQKAGVKPDGGIG